MPKQPGLYASNRSSRESIGFLVLLVGLFCWGPGCSKPPQSLFDAGKKGGATDADASDPFEELRTNMLNRPRRIILNNDGADAISEAQSATPAGLLAARTTGLENTQVDSLFYCTNRGGVASHSHNSEISEIFTRTDGRYKNNITANLLEQGTDPLQVMIDWGKSNDVEVFWSERMNDRHDVANPALLSKWKKEHPQFLIGTEANPPLHGGWTQVDYSHQEVRTLMLSIIAEVANNYDIDGIELDFFRHPTFFKSVANGGYATAPEIGLMSGFVRSVREATEEAGRKRGRPILLAIRVPDSVPMALAMGLDLEEWLSNDTIDLLIGAGYFRVNTWSYLVELGRKHNTKVYAGLTDSRYKAKTAPLNRRSNVSYRGRAQQAWQAGVDGIYLFNMFNQDREFLKEIGSKTDLSPLGKTYFATFLARRSKSYNNPEFWLANGFDWLTTSILSPKDPVFIAPGQTDFVHIELGDDFSDLPAGNNAEVFLHFLSDGGAAIENVRVGSTTLSAIESMTPWTTMQIPINALQPGVNTIALKAGETSPWHVEWSASDGKPMIPPWTKSGTEENGNLVEIQEDALLIADRGTATGTYFYYKYPWRALNEHPSEVEVSVKVISGWNAITIYDGTSQERLVLHPGYIETLYSNLRFDMDTTDSFHSYRIVTRGTSIKVYIDEVLRVNGIDQFTRSADGRNEVGIGASNSPSQGEALWQSVRIQSPGLVGAKVYDLAITTKIVESQE